jgi:hypothetical protein
MQDRFRVTAAGSQMQIGDPASAQFVHGLPY